MIRKNFKIGGKQERFQFMLFYRPLFNSSTKWEQAAVKDLRNGKTNCWYKSTKNI